MTTIRTNPEKKAEPFHKPSCEIKMVELEASDGVFEAVLRVQNCEQAHVSTTRTRSIWHDHLGDCSGDVLRPFLPYVRGISKQEVVKVGDCEPCVFGKSVRALRMAAAHKNTMAASPLDSVFFDVVCTIKHRSIGRSKYFVTLLDESIGYFIVRFINCKSEETDAVMGIIEELETLFFPKVRHMELIYRNVVKCVRSDGGGEYLGMNSLIGSKVGVLSMKLLPLNLPSRTATPKDSITPFSTWQGRCFMVPKIRGIISGLRR